MECIQNKEINSEIEVNSLINPNDRDTSIYHAIHSAIQSQAHSAKKTFHASKNSETLLARLTNRIINPFGYDITIE